jgi:hypothetical protein
MVAGRGRSNSSPLPVLRERGRGEGVIDLLLGTMTLSSLHPHRHPAPSDHANVYAPWTKNVSRKFPVLQFYCKVDPTADVTDNADVLRGRSTYLRNPSFVIYHADLRRPRQTPLITVLSSTDAGQKNSEIGIFRTELYKLVSRVESRVSCSLCTLRIAVPLLWCIWRGCHALEFNCYAQVLQRPHPALPLPPPLAPSQPPRYARISLVTEILTRRFLEVIPQCLLLC